ncbi:TIR domain-containing protein [uncultured Modestobacter sp.]|uniref:TIR domain-containing protein n=1 Tax=uncultured Modestobacter sp. TaxID=380048 RepID=UPI0026102875|nr:TIR domain-containing protein [uncultured Modestobacter sp.]
MPVPSSDDGARLLGTIWDFLTQLGAWPTVGQVASRLDRRHDVAFEEALPNVPAALLYGVHPNRLPSDDESIGLTIAGAAVVEGAAESLRLAVAAVGLAAQLHRDWEPPVADRNEELVFTAADLSERLPVPAAGRAALLAQVGALLRTESWGWRSASHGATSDAWSFSIDRSVRRFRDVVDVSDFWERAHPMVRPGAGDTVGAPAPAGASSPLEGAKEKADVGSRVANRSIFLVHGRDHDARNALIELLRSFDLRVVTWREATSKAAGGGTPYTGDIVRAGLEMANAVVVLLTPDDVGYVRPAFREERDGADELQPTGQARLNVIFEAGMAMALGRERVVIVEVGVTRGLSDTAGIHTIRLRDDPESRKDFAARLRNAGLTVDTDGESWRTAGSFDRSPLAPGDLTLEVVQAAGYPNLRGIQATEQSPSVRLTDTLVASRLGRLDSSHSTDVVGELTNESSAALNLVLLGATYFDESGRIVGTADGVVNGLLGGQTKVFRLSSVGSVKDVARFAVQSNGTG